MKKAIVTLCAILAVSTSLMAAGHVDSVRYLTTKVTICFKNIEYFLEMHDKKVCE